MPTVKKSKKVQSSTTYTNMFLAYAAFWRRGFTQWAGTSSRSEFWWTILVNALIYVMWALVAFLCMTMDFVLTGDVGLMFGLATLLGVIYSIVIAIPMISLRTRRLHDAGLSAWWWLLVLLCVVPFASVVAGVVMFIFSLLPTKTDGNPYHKFNK